MLGSPALAGVTLQAHTDQAATRKGEVSPLPSAAW